MLISNVCKYGFMCSAIKKSCKESNIYVVCTRCGWSSEILKGKPNLGVTFNFDKQDVIDFTKFSKMTMCRASEANSEK